MDYSKLNKSNIYCNHCFNEGIIHILPFEENRNLVKLCEKHNKNKGNFYILMYRKEHDRFLPVRGRNPKRIAEIDKPKATGEGKCSICGTLNNKRDQNGRGKDVCNCSGKWYQEHNSSSEMREKSRISMLKIIENPNIQYPCKKCGNKDRYQPLEKCNKCGYTPHKDIFHCQKCGAHISSPNSICPVCNFKIKQYFQCKQCGNLLYDELNGLCDKCGTFNKIIGLSNFQNKDNVLFYKGEEIHSVINKLYTGEYDIRNFPGWEKRLGHWCYNGIDILTSEKILLNKNFQLKDNVLFYKNHIWEDYKKIFMNNKISKFSNKIIDDYNAFWQNTYRINKNDSTGQNAMEYELVERGVKWFVYIKFYSINDEIKPLVVGKTGSHLVNHSGTDIRFDLNNINKPARRFLIENKLNWYYDKILIIPCESEEESLYYEKEIFEKYNLFYS